MDIDSLPIRPISPADRDAVLEIFNYYILNSFAAYPEKPVGPEFFDMILAAIRNYPSGVLVQPDGNVAGFGFLRAYNPMPAFRKTAEISYFIKAEFNRSGLGTRLLEYLLDDAKQRGLQCILASISSLNQPSLQFHQKNGFQRCGCFKGVGVKNQKTFDLIWMQRFIIPMNE